MIKETKKPQIAIYQVIGDKQKIRVRIEDENVWLTQKLIAELFDVDVRTVNEHLVNIYSEHELDENSTIRNFRTVQKEASKEMQLKRYTNVVAELKKAWQENPLLPELEENLKTLTTLWK